jgi:bifunctional non-homologous end joining protein LigD
VTWEELNEVERSDTFTIADVEVLLKRAKSRRLEGWGQADQRLPLG